MLNDYSDRGLTRLLYEGVPMHWVVVLDATYKAANGFRGAVFVIGADRQVWNSQGGTHPQFNVGRDFAIANARLYGHVAITDGVWIRDNFIEGLCQPSWWHWLKGDPKIVPLLAAHTKALARLGAVACAGSTLFK
jgi:hypothetical protein